LLNLQVSVYKQAIYQPVLYQISKKYMTLKKFLMEKFIIALLVSGALVLLGREMISAGHQQEPRMISGYFSTRTFDYKDPFSYTTRDSLPSFQQSTTIVRQYNDQMVKMRMENDKVVELEIDGKIIPPAEYDQHGQLIEELSSSAGGRGRQGNGSFYFDQRSFGFPFGENGQMDMDSMLKSFGFEGFGHSFSFGDLSQEMERMRQGMQGFQFDMDTLGRDGSFGKSYRFYFDGNDFHVEEGGQSSESGQSLDANQDVQQFLGQKLNEDGLLLPDQDNQIELTGKHLKINGEKQPSNIWNKYRRLFESETGTTLEKQSRIKFTFVGKTPKRKYKVI
jgi:hypothetical protein